MEDATNEHAHLIDHSIREKMTLLDKYGDNVFSDKLTIITNFAPYAKYVRLNVPARSPEHRIIFVRQGTKTLNISFRDYKLTPGTLLLTPAGSVLTTKEQSADYRVKSIAFRIPKAESLRLIDYDVTSLQLSASNQALVDNYFSLIRQLAGQTNPDSNGMEFLITSLLCIIQEWNHEQNESNTPERLPKAADISFRFVRMITTGGIPQRSPSYYAEKMNVTKGYLSQIVMKYSNNTVMGWINEKTILESKILLAETDDTLEQIAEALHLNSASQFIKFYQKQENETPNAFRKRAKQNPLGSLD